MPQTVRADRLKQATPNYPYSNRTTVAIGFDANVNSSTVTGVYASHIHHMSVCHGKPTRSTPTTEPYSVAASTEVARGNKEVQRTGVSYAKERSPPKNPDVVPEEPQAYAILGLIRSSQPKQAPMNPIPIHGFLKPSWLSKMSKSTSKRPLRCTDIWTDAFNIRFTNQTHECSNPSEANGYDIARLRTSMP